MYWKGVKRVLNTVSENRFSTPFKQRMTHQKQNLSPLQELQYEKFLEIVEKSIEIGVTELNLSRTWLGTLPPQLDNFADIDEPISYNFILELLPAEIGQLINLTTLKLSYHKLQKLPPEIGNLHKLSVLDVSHNKLMVLPSEIGNLHSLTILNLRANQLHTLPFAIIQLNKLKNLDLQENPLPIPLNILQQTTNPAMIIEYYFSNVVKKI
ncbi:MAG: hypothetical protein B6242_03020 [Anaerolineaceae bacterium 4572_78]|nr:MAG: hypothetical protein B6242_03020 [Anaerolineaceae bacterium 4572_78]